jgi:pimeloyl-ACP methyl ester carboxylesterase
MRLEQNALRGFRAGRAPGESARASGPARPVLLLVPGAWHGPWVWEKVQPELTARGWLVQTMDLPSTADRGGPRGDLYDDAAAVRQRIEGIEGSVVVVAHSYGAVPATQGAADLPNVRHIVYVCGFVLDVGESLLGLLGTEPDWWVVDGDIVAVDNPRAAFFHDVGREDVERAIARMKPFNRVAATQALTSAAWHSVSSTYIVCDHDAKIDAGQWMFAKRAAEIRRPPSSHSPMLSMPSELTSLIGEAADRSA